MKVRTEEILSPALRNDLYELLSASFNPDGIDELGHLLFRNYSGHELIGADKHVTLSRARAAKALVDHAEDRGKVSDLVQLLAELDGSQFMGRTLTIDGIEVFFNALARIGIVYDPVHRKLYHTEEDISEMRNWGSLRDGKTYEIAAMSVDIVGNSQIVREYGTKRAEELSYSLLRFLQHKLDDYDGRIWSWAGDGGILAFALEGCVNRAVMCGVDIQRSLPLFCLSPEFPIDRNISLRIGIDAGAVKFTTETGRIVSDVMNYAAHLEKGATEAGCVSASIRVANECDAKLLRLFTPNGMFEGTECLTTPALDGLFQERDGVQEPIGTSGQAG